MLRSAPKKSCTVRIYNGFGSAGETINTTSPKKAQILLLRLSPQRLNMCDGQFPPCKQLSGVDGCHQIDVEADEPYGCVDLDHWIAPFVVPPDYIRQTRAQVKLGVAVRGRSLNPGLGQLQ